MANASNVASTPTGQGLPIPYLTAVWAGVPMDEILAGLAKGSILAPPGAPAGWRPGGAGPAADGAAESSALQANARAPIPSTSHDPNLLAPGAADRAKVSHWLRTLDPDLDAQGFDRIWAGAGSTDAQRASTLTAFLGRTLLGPDVTATDEAAARGALDRFVDRTSHRARVVDLSGKTGAELAELAATDIGYRHALEHMQPLALVGNRNLFAAINADGHLDRFDSDTGEALLSNAWLADRGKYMAWRSAELAGADTSLASAQGWMFTDHNQVGADGKPLVVELQGTDATMARHQVIFGDNTAETLRGGSGTDRLYGGAGDDMLRGGAGADRLEGGDGDDLALGGAGNDQLLGNRGADELDGGGGRDFLAGGSGRDLLAGGGGDDRLEGGTGHDIYAFDAGDGRDTIADIDGLGEVVIDGIAVSGSMVQADGAWASADGRFAMDFDGAVGGAGTLTIRPTAANASAGDSITIENWTNGNLGISLQGQDDAASAEAFDAQASIAVDGSGTTDASNQVATTSAVIAYGDTAPNQGTSSGAVPADGADATTTTADSEAGTPADAPGDASDGSDGGSTGSAGSTAEAFDFEAGLASLLAWPESEFAAIDPARMQQAIDAFSGVLEPPDVPHGTAAAAEHPTSEALTEADIADALAANSADYDADEVAGSDAAGRAPQWLQTDGMAMPSDGRAAGTWPGGTVQR